MTSKNLNIREWIAYIVLLLATLFTITSCSSIRYYKKVAKDATPRSEAKRNILAPVCVAEFPNKQSVDTAVEYIYIADTADNYNLKVIIKQLLRQLQQRPECPQIDEDSLYNAIKSSIKIDTIKVKEKVTIHTIDSAYIYQLTQQHDIRYNVLLKKLNDTTEALHQSQDKVNYYEQGVKSNKQLLKWFWKLNWWWIMLLIGATSAIVWIGKKANMLSLLKK